MNTKLVLKLNGYILLFDAVAMLLPLAVALYYGEQAGLAFLPAMLISVIVGVPSVLFANPKRQDLYAREGLATVGIAWFMMSFIGCLPFFFSGEIPNLVDCFFETASGFTTTGSTILTDVEALSRCLLFWRSFTHWIGGMGVLVFVMSFANLAGNHNMHLLRAESPGPMVEKVMPKAKTSSKVLYGMYIGLTLLQIVCLLAGKMPLFDAVTTTFGTAGTGGFTIKNSGLADYSTYVQAVVTVFMLLFSVNFNIYFLILARKFKPVFKDEELRSFFIIVFFAILLITISNMRVFDNIWSNIHHTSFTVASIISTSGFATLNFGIWPTFSRAILVVLMFVGACAGSTGGGIKVSRIVILLKSLKREFSSLVHPKSVKTIRINGKRVDEETLRRTNVYLICYLLVLVVSFLIISLDNFDFETNFTATVTTFNNVGPGMAMVGPVGNFSRFSNLSKIVFAVDMICGRLELFPVMILLLPQAWKKY